MEPCPSSSRSNRSPLRARPRAFRTIAIAGLFALAAAAAWGASAGRLPSLSAARHTASAGLETVARFVGPPPRQRALVYTGGLTFLLCIPLAISWRRRRARERLCAAIEALQQDRAPVVFEAARGIRPLRRASESEAASAAAAELLPAPGPTPPELAARAADLRPSAVRDAAARALVLRAASERSEARRRAAALRARARHEERADAPAPEAAAPTVEVIVDARADEAPSPADLVRELAPAAQPAPLRLAPKPPTRPDPRPEAVAPAAPAPRAASGAGAAAPASRGAGRVAILRASGPLTFEWLEECLARDPQDVHARLDLCTALLVGERFEEAERVAREGLVCDATNGRLLLRLSEALSGQERNDEALEAAVRAARSHRSRKAILHLTRLSAVTGRFSPGDGARLRRALENRPNDPVFLHALGAFEAQHGNPRHALPILRLALRHERSPRWRRIVSREIAQLRADELGASGDARRSAAS